MQTKSIQGNELEHKMSIHRERGRQTMPTNNITYCTVYVYCMWDGWFFRDGSMNRSNGWEEKIHGSSSKKSCRSIELHPISNKRERRKWPLHPKSCHTFHTLLQNPKESCLSCRSPHIFHFFSSKWRGFGSLSNQCAHGPPELLWRRLSRNLAKFHEKIPHQNRVWHTAKKRENTHKNNDEDIMKTWHDALNSLEISHGTISISSNIQPKSIKVNNKTSSFFFGFGHCRADYRTRVDVCSWLAPIFGGVASLKLTWK